MAGLAVPSVRTRLPLRVIRIRLALHAELTRLSLPAVRARLTLPAVRARLTLPAVRARLARHAELTRLTLPAIWARLTLPAVRARLTLNVKLTRLSLRVKGPRLPLQAERSRLSLRAVRTWRRPLHAVRTWLTLGAVRARLPWQAVTTRPGGPAGGGVPRCQRVPARSRVAGEAGRAAAGHAGAGRETGRRPVAGIRAVPWDGPGGGATRPRKSTRPWPARSGSRSRSARSGETALADERPRTGKHAANWGTCLTWECGTGGEVSLARERPRGCVRVLRRARSVTVRRRAVSRTAHGRSVGRPPGGGGRTSRRVARAAFGRNDQAAWRVDGRGGEDPLPICVDEVNRPSPAIRDVGAGSRTLTLVRGGWALSRTDVVSGPRGIRSHRSRPGRPDREPCGRERPRSRPVNWCLAGHPEVAGRSVLTRRAVLGRAELPARHWLTGLDARTERTRLSELSRLSERTGRGERTGSGERPRRGKLALGHRSAVGRPRAGHELARR